MATVDTNKLRLKALKKKSYAHKKSAYDLESALSNITRSLFPSRQEQPRDEKKQNAVDYSDKINELEKKLASVKSENADDAETRDSETQKSLSQLRKALSGQLESLGESTMENDKALQEAINKSSEIRSKSQEDAAEEKSIENDDDDVDTNVATYGLHNNFGRPSMEKVETPAEEIPAGTNNKAKSIVAKIGEFVDVGNFKYKISNTFGMRTGKNSVKGREGQHSRGIDVVGVDAQGRGSNIPIAIADGVIKDITVQGTGEAYKPDAVGADGKQLPASGGYIMHVQLPNGKVMQYMHLGKDVMLDKDILIGKSIKRGDVLHTRDNSKGSGSQSGPHSKIAITSVGKNGEYLRDYDNPENDPTPYLFGKA